MTYEFLQSLYDDLVLIASGIVVKRYDLARSYETAETAAAFELYNACINGSRYFKNFPSFEVKILEKYLEPSEVYACTINPNNIPTKYREQIVEDQAQWIIANYEEKNEYYRMLTGLPRTNDLRYIYILDQEDIPTDIPIHEMNNYQIAKLESRGIIERLKRERPDAEYLDFLGINKIDLLTARLAKPFEILRLGSPKNDRTLDLFQREYYGARRYVMATVYNRAILTTTELYDPVIGMMMLTLAIRNTLVPDENSYLSFEEILDAILDSYGMLGYFQRFPYMYKRKLVMAMDKLLQIKGTDGVILDICQLFQGTNFTANRYYLMKTNKKNEDGTIQFTGGTDPKTGLPIMDPVEDQDIAFLKSTIRDREMEYDQEAWTDYTQVTNNDYLWQLTQKEYEDLHSERFNLWMSKYIGIQAAYDVSSVTFEVCYFLNLLLQSGEKMQRMKIVNQYATGGNCDIYTAVVFMLDIMAKRSGFDGNIVYEPEHIAEILRFDFTDIEDELKQIRDSYEQLVDVDDKTDIVYGKYTNESDVPFRNLTEPNPITNRSNTIESYVNNRDYYDAILYEMHHTTDIRRYEALAKLKECLYISAMEKKDFTLSTGEAANTDHDMLMDIDPKLAAKIDSYDDAKAEKDPVYAEKRDKELNDLLLYILNKLEEFFNTDELQYLFLNTPNIFVSVISKYLRTAINVFKASTVQLESINVLFNVGDHDPIRIIDQKALHQHEIINDTVYIYDEIAFHKHLVIDDTAYVLDKAYTDEKVAFMQGG